MTYPGNQRNWFRRARQDSEAGQAIVELALTLPILVLLLLGAVEFGRFALLWIEITNAAKAAAQYGSQNSNYAADVAGMQAVAAQDAPDVTAQCTAFNTNVSGALPAATCSCVSAGVSSASSCSSTTCAGYLVQKLTVTTSATCTPLIYPRGFGGPITLTGKAVQEVLK